MLPGDNSKVGVGGKAMGVTGKAMPGELGKRALVANNLTRRGWSPIERQRLEQARRAMSEYEKHLQDVEALSRQIKEDGAEVFHADAYFLNFMRDQTQAFRETEAALIRALVAMLFVRDARVRDETIKAFSKLLQTYPELAHKAYKHRDLPLRVEPRLELRFDVADGLGDVVGVARGVAAMECPLWC